MAAACQIEIKTRIVSSSSSSIRSRLIRETIEARITDTAVEILHKGGRVASHIRSHSIVIVARGDDARGRSVRVLPLILFDSCSDHKCEVEQETKRRPREADLGDQGKIRPRRKADEHDSVDRLVQICRDCDAVVE
jgi:hypothetical protein